MENITNNSITQKNVDLEIKEFFEALSQMPKKSKCGRKKKLTPEQTKVVAEKYAEGEYAEGEYTIESIALAMRVSPETIRRAVNQLNE